SLDPPEHGLHPGQALRGVDDGNAELTGGGDGAERVVEVVETGEGQLEPGRTLGRVDGRLDPRHAPQSDLGGRDSGVGPAHATALTAVVAEMADEGALVGQLVSADPAELCVVGMLEFGQSLGGIIDPEIDRVWPALVADVRDQGI